MNDKWLRIIGISGMGIGFPLITYVIPYYLGIKPSFDPLDVVLSGVSYYSFFNVLGCMFTALIIWEGNRWIIKTLNKYLSWKDRPFTRGSIQILSAIVFTFITVVFLAVVTGCAFNSFFLYMNFLFCTAITFLVHTVYEGYFFFEKWRASELRAEKLKQESIISQFEALKSQVDPHFLFNSFNTLNILMDEDLKLAKQFVQKLSFVYRYVLQHKDKEVVELKTELEFIESYTYLLKKRFGENLNINFKIDDKHYDQYIPPLTLQMLIENAVKHNEISKEKPLNIDIKSENDKYIVVENNLQKKTSSVETTQIGLNNITNRYKYLTDEVVDIIKTSLKFKVSLPLLKIAP